MKFIEITIYGSKVKSYINVDHVLKISVADKNTTYIYCINDSGFYVDEDINTIISLIKG